MDTQEITIRVIQEAATIYQSASQQDRRKLDLLLSLRLSETAEPSRTIDAIMRDAGQEAQLSGLTEDVLKEILDGR